MTTEDHMTIEDHMKREDGVCQGIDDLCAVLGEMFQLFPEQTIKFNIKLWVEDKDDEVQEISGDVSPDGLYYHNV